MLACFRRLATRSIGAKQNGGIICLREQSLRFRWRAGLIVLLGN
jgi:hypothetical protein